MSTRSIILVTGKHKYNGDETIRLYKHSDGYPTGNLPVILEALDKAIKQVGEDHNRFEWSKSTLSTGQLVGNLIGAATTVYGMGAHLEETYEGSLKPEHLGDQWDLEWIYVLNLNDKTLNIYGGGFTGKSPQHAFKRGPVDPLKYADCLRDEFKDSERNETRDLIKSIESLGFTVNPELSNIVELEAAKKRRKKVGAK